MIKSRNFILYDRRADGPADQPAGVSVQLQCESSPAPRHPESTAGETSGFPSGVALGKSLGKSDLKEHLGEQDKITGHW